MKIKQLVSIVLMTSAFLALLTTRVLSQEKSSIAVDLSAASTDSWSSTQKAPLLPKARIVKPITEIRRLSEIEHPSNSARTLLVQSPTPQATPTDQVVQVTGVKANPTNKGLDLILQTSKGQVLQPINRSAGKSFIADIPSSQLRLPSGDAFTFRSQTPIAGVTEITVTNLNANTIRVTVLGEAKLPTVELFDSPNEGLIFGVASTAPVAQQQQPSTQQPQTQRSESQTQPTKPSDQGDEPIELVVRGEQDTYRVTDGSTATKTDTPLRDIPQSIQVIPQKLIEDQQTTRIGDVLRNVSGIQEPSATSNSLFDSFYIRGFNSANSILKNGLRERTASQVPNETVNLERIEVLKGPSSVLYGEGGGLGGTINLVTKQPLRDPFYAVEAVLGSFDFYRGTVDFSAPVNADKTLLYRLTGAVQTSRSFVDVVNQQRYFVSPVLTWLISKNTKLTFEAEYTNVPNIDNFGLPAVGTVLFNSNGKIQRNRFTSEPTDTDNRSTLRVSYNLEHHFSENWQIRNTFRYTLFRSNQNEVDPTGLSPDNRFLLREYDGNAKPGYVTQANIFSLDTYVVGKFKTGGIQHQLVTGFDLFRSLRPANEYITRTAPSLDLFNPTYGLPIGQITSISKSSFQQDNLGLFIQDQITLAENLKLLLGGRFDIVSQDQDDKIASTNTFQQNEAFSPRVGIVYQPIRAISLYANYSRSFLQVVGTAFDNRLFEPERGTSYEVGLKADVTKKIAATLAFYDLTRSNVLTTDPANSNFSIQTGEQRSKGVELDLAGEILPGWNIIAGYAYTDAEITKDNTYAVGNLLNNVPKHSFNIWTSYEIQSGVLKGFGVGGGLFFVGDREGDLANTFKLPSYLRTDAAIFYKRDRFRAAINFKNLFNVDYFDSALSKLSVYPGDPFTVQGTISWQF